MLKSFQQALDNRIGENCKFFTLSDSRGGCCTKWSVDSGCRSVKNKFRRFENLVVRIWIVRVVVGVLELETVLNSLPQCGLESSGEGTGLFICRESVFAD